MRLDEEDRGEALTEPIGEASAMMQRCGESPRHKVLVLFSGPYDRQDGIQEQLRRFGSEVVMIDNDEKNGGDATHDLLNEAFYAELLRRVKSGEFSAVIAAPPCSTFSIARFFPVANNRDHGPPPVRTRDLPRGIVEQSAGYKLEAERANLLVTRTCTILGAAFNSGAEFILENPADRGNPRDRYLFLHADHAPIWVLSEVQLLQETTGARQITFPMCEVGHQSQKLTTLLVTSNLASQLDFLSDLRCRHKSHDAVGGRRDKDGVKFTSAQASQYPAQLNFIFAQAIAEATTPSIDGVCPRSTEDPEWISGWEVQRDREGRSYRTAIIDSDQLMGP